MSDPGLEHLGTERSDLYCQRCERRTASRELYREESDGSLVRIVVCWEVSCGLAYDLELGVLNARRLKGD